MMGVKVLLKKNKALKKAAKALYLAGCHVLYAAMKHTLRTDARLVVFDAFQGRGCACSPLTLYKAMLADARYGEYRFAWVLRKPENAPEALINARTELVKFDSPRAMARYAKAGYWITNARLRGYCVPKKKQQYIQCWHGTPYKKIGCDVTAGANATASVAKNRREYEAEGRRITRLLSPSPFCSEKFASAFGLSFPGGREKLLEAGYPRNDALFKADAARIAAIKNTLGIPPGHQVILYAPTFRDNSFNAADGYTFAPPLDFHRLRKALPENCMVLFRAHYFVADRFDFSAYSDFLKNVSAYGDINDLYLASDLLVTDYSSVFFDFANLGKPMVFFLFDYEEYRDRMRDFYLPAEELPGILTRTQDELETAVCALLSRGMTAEQAEKLAAFHRRFNPRDGADAAGAVLKRIFG
ncbi:MAG: CDP-glycerol glycerophosphotransferase family protein [Oscillospiraceae bacterium]